MALSMEEQRQLSEIASRLRADDPRLAERLAAFGGRRGRRVKAVAAVVAALVLLSTVCAAVVVFGT